MEEGLDLMKIVDCCTISHLVSESENNSSFYKWHVIVIA